MHQMDQDPSNAELLLAIQGFANNNEQRLQGIENKIDTLATKVEVAEIKQTVACISEDVKEIKQDVTELQKKADNTAIILDGISKNVSTIKQEQVATIDWLQPAYA